MKMGSLDNSFLVRANAVDVFRNRAGGALADANRVKLAVPRASTSPPRGPPPSTGESSMRAPRHRPPR